MTAKPGTTWTYTADAPLGVGPEAIQPGTVVTVRELVDAATPGAHNDREDAVVLECEGHPTIGYDDNGDPTVARPVRAFSVSVDQFATDFTKGA